MVKSKHKILSIVLCLVLAVSVVFAASAQAFAASGDTVYVKANNGWTNLYCYMWNDSGNNSAWPGVKMTSVGDNVYSYQLTGDYNNIIFNNGSGGNGNQTADLTYAGNGKIYDLSAGTWSDYGDIPATTASTAATTATKATTATTATTPVGDGTTVYLNNESNWSTPYVYMWNSDSDNNAAWPGVAMTNLGNGEWIYTASKTYANCIFSNSGSSQTSDLTAKDGYIYNNSTNSWKEYDTSPIKVSEYSVNPSSDIYTGTEVTLSATAKSTDSTAVYYKFSVTKSGTSTVIQNFGSSSTATWTPTETGAYTITFDFKDNANNTNQRTTEITVGDDSSLTKPVIKSVSPKNLAEIKVNTSATVSVNAGGGKTGTNLLFYKYVVKDPSGTQNTPYYTLNSTYKFTPSSVGTYTVDVYVQGSDNSTVSKTYTYDVKENVTPTTVAPTTAEPTTVAPTTVAPTTVAPTEAPSTVAKIKGDANGDGRVSIQDASYVQKHIALYDGYEREDLETMDMNGDGKVTVVDAALIQRLLLDL